MAPETLGGFVVVVFVACSVSAAAELPVVVPGVVLDKGLIVDCDTCCPEASLESWARLRRRRRAKARRVMRSEKPVKTTPARKMLRGRLGRSWEG
jgi:hypothetical protein